jgi:4'-phosphopantetheinyl transferase
LTTTDSPTDRDEAAEVRWLDLADVTADDEARWLRLLDEKERARAARFYRASDRLAFVAAHALLRATLTRALGGRPESWRFVEAAQGKPSLDPAMGQPPLEFNLSHAQGAVACALTRGAPIGVDIESPNRDVDLLALARSFFARAEVALLEAVAEDERVATFLHLWTLKEAYVKARGDGLSLPLDRFAFSLDPIGIELPDASPAEPSIWRFASLRLSGGHRLSVAARSQRPLRFDIRRASPTDIDEAADPPPHPFRRSTETSA